MADAAFVDPGDWTDQNGKPVGAAPPQASVPSVPTEPTDWQPAPTTSAAPVYSGSIFPLSRYADGSVQFDPNAGIVGSVKNVLTGLPALAHRVDAERAANTATPETAGQVLNAAALTTPGDLRIPGPTQASNATAIGMAHDLGVPGVPAPMPAVRDVPVPTADELYSAANAAYEKAKGLGVHYDPQAVGSLAFETQQSLDEDGIHGVLAPKTHAILSTLQSPVGSNSAGSVTVPLTGLESARRLFGRISAKDPDPTERLAAGQAQQAISGFMENPPEEAVLAGPAAEAGQLYQQARANYAAASRSDLITGREEAAQFQAERAHTGTNFDNSLRQRLSPLVAPGNAQNRLLSGFTPDEKDSVADLVTGSTGRNLSRRAGNMLGSGEGVGGLGLGVVGAIEGAHQFGPAGLVLGAGPPIAGAALRANTNRMAHAAVGATDEMLRKRSPLYEQRAAAAPLATPADTGLNTAVRGAGQVQPYGQNGTGGPNDTAGPNPVFYERGGAVYAPRVKRMLHDLRQE